MKHQRIGIRNNRESLKQTYVDVHNMIYTKIASNKSQKQFRTPKAFHFRKKTSYIFSHFTRFSCHLDFVGHSKKSPGPQVYTKKQG